MGEKKEKRFSVKSGIFDLIPLKPEEIKEALELEDEVGEIIKQPIQDSYNSLEKMYQDENNDYIWYTLWRLVKIDADRSTHTLGYLRFFGVPELGQVELALELKKIYRNRGFGTNILKIITDWAFLRKNIYEINAHFHRENDSAINAFTKAGYMFREQEGEIEYYSRTKESSAWSGLYLVIGVWAGLAMGIIFNNLLIGIASGIVIGLICGVILDQKEKEKRAKVTGTTSERTKRRR